MPLELTAEATSRTVKTKNWEIHYHEAGQGHPLVMLHGSGPGATGWSNFGPNLRSLANDFRVIAVDMPGWGASDAVIPDERDHVEAALQLLDALKIDKAAFVGNSMGGFNSVSFAVKHPDRISHLITMGAGAPGVRPSIFAPGNGLSEGLKILLRGYQNPSMETIRDVVDIMTYDSAFVTDELISERLDATLGRPDHLANFLAGGFEKISRAVITADDLVGIRVPTLVFHGRDDRVVHYENSLKLVSLVPDSRLVLMNRCGHWLQLEYADEFNRLVGGFVSAR
ncbi:alpha/beta fold hydrolase [Streptomyces sp. NPDC088847]|uniref:alpha/beta fold hydrolase n=1 Tax=Streptomyces sp. NPDC088847 TaxID=3365909 RepID=UPI00380191B1